MTAAFLAFAITVLLWAAARDARINAAQRATDDGEE